MTEEGVVAEIIVLRNLDKSDEELADRWVMSTYLFSGGDKEGRVIDQSIEVRPEGLVVKVAYPSLNLALFARLKCPPDMRFIV